MFNYYELHDAEIAERDEIMAELAEEYGAFDHLPEDERDEGAWCIGGTREAGGLWVSCSNRVDEADMLCDDCSDNYMPSSLAEDRLAG